MSVSFLVTFQAIMEYLQKAREAKEKLDEATEQMDRAAQALCSNGGFVGDAAQAFAQEQKVLYGYCKDLSSIGEEYMATLEKVREIYDNAETNVNTAIRG